MPTTDYVAERNCPPAQPSTTYRPRNIAPGIIGVVAAQRLGAAVRANLTDLAAMVNPATGGTYRRTADVCVIAQFGLHERARGVVWDTSKMLHGEFGGYFAPADFDALLPTHIMTERIFDELGDDFVDQQLCHMMRTGIVFVTKPSLSMIVSPNLLSLASSFGRVDSELACLARHRRAQARGRPPAPHRGRRTAAQEDAQRGPRVDHVAQRPDGCRASRRRRRAHRASRAQAVHSRRYA